MTFTQFFQYVFMPIVLGVTSVAFFRQFVRFVKEMIDEES